ncbi:MAG: creatininase family protein [Anaerolineae bacterium]|nr:creatininase family protein [Anaerolineae bacterium]
MPVTYLERLFPHELAAILQRKPALVLPFGTIEWHSYHLPVGLDSLKAQALAERIAETADIILGPLTPWAVGGVPFPYTIKFDLPLIETLMVRIFEQMAVFGFKVVLALTGHFGLEQTLAIKRASLQFMRQSPITVWGAGEFEAAVALGYKGDHAAKWETSLLWASHSDLIRLDAVAADQPLPGVQGEDPRGSASQQLGETAVQAIVSRWAALSDDLLQLDGVRRMQYIEALSVGVRVLEALLAERQAKPRSQVPPLATPAYLDHLDALYRFDFPAAQRHAELKLTNLQA